METLTSYYLSCYYYSENKKGVGRAKKCFTSLFYSSFHWKSLHLFNPISLTIIIKQIKDLQYYNAHSFPCFISESPIHVFSLFKGSVNGTELYYKEVARFKIWSLPWFDAYVNLKLYFYSLLEICCWHFLLI